jgi:YVTN family beta-propeller protein
MLMTILSSQVTAVPPQFESAHIHPIDVIGNRILVVNTPDARLSIFGWQDGVPVLESEVRVGMEPVTVRAKDDNTAWVVNHISDDISVVDLDTGTVSHTILLGDEPTDVGFVLDPIQDDGSLWAVIVLSQEDRVVVHDAEPPFGAIASLEIPGSDPRALAVTPDRHAVWVAVFESGNLTTRVPREIVKLPNAPWGGELPPIVPPLNPDLPEEFFPDNSIIVKNIDGSWMDEQGGDWTSFITWQISDIDLVRIDISPNPSVTQEMSGVGTLIEDLVVDPATGDVWAVNIESMNHIYFEPKLIGEFVLNRISKVDGVTGQVEAFSLNPHITFGSPSEPALRAESLAVPTEVFISDATGEPELYVTSIGGERIAVIDPLTGDLKRRLVTQEGASGLAYYAPGGVFIQVDRMTNRIGLIDPLSGSTGDWIDIGKSGWDPTPQQIRDGRRFLYTGAHSAHGTASCASCHPSGNMDNMGWDLGDPQGEMQFRPPDLNFHPLKGPMTTQTLRGMLDTGPLHWRGDREDFTRFNPAFALLLGGDTLSTAEMQDYETFAMSLVYPPNPLRTIRDEMVDIGNGGDPLEGLSLFNTTNVTCVGCHAFPAGTNGDVIFLGEPFGSQPFKIAQLRNLYEKTGFDDLTGSTVNKRGFGYLHDGRDNNLSTFLSEPVFGLNEQEKLDLEAFLMQFPAGTHPATGAALTLDASNLNDPDVSQRLSDYEAVILAGEIDLIVYGPVNDEDRGWVWIGQNGGQHFFQSDRADDVWTWAEIVDAISNQAAVLTLLGVPPGEGVRMGVDRDLDGFLDRDEIDAGSDPADPDNGPSAVDDPSVSARPELARIISLFPSPFSRRTVVDFYLPAEGTVVLEVFDVQGRRVRQIARSRFDAGAHSLAWDGRDDSGRPTPAGVYFARLQAGTIRDARKVIRIE